MQLKDLQDTSLQSDTQKTSVYVIKKEVDLGYNNNNNNNNNNNVIYPVTEGINSPIPGKHTRLVSIASKGLSIFMICKYCET